jgi:hypothetical protein
MRCDLLPVFAVVALVGCAEPGGEAPKPDGGPAVDAGSSPSDAGTLDSGVTDSGVLDAGSGIDPSSFTVTFPSEFVPVGDDRTRCVVLELGNNQPAKIGAMHLLTTGPTFSFELYATDEALSATPADCAPLRSITEAGHNTMLISYSHDETVTMHADVAYTLAVHQHLRLVLHSWNATSGAEDTGATVTLTTSPTATHEAKFVMLMNADATVPGKLSATMIANFAGWNGLAENARFFSVAGYGQRFGTEFQIYQTDNQQFPVGGPLIDQSPYDFANSARWTGTPFTLPIYNYFHLQCTWVNPLSNEVHSGAGIDDVLCGMGAYYYGTDAPQICAMTSNPSPEAICCPGNAKCGSIF